MPVPCILWVLALLDSLNPRAKTFVVVSSPHSSAGSPAPGRTDEVSYRSQKEKPKGGEVSMGKKVFKIISPFLLGVFFHILLNISPKFIFLHIQKKPPEVLCFFVSFSGTNTELQEVFGCQGPKTNQPKKTLRIFREPCDIGLRAHRVSAGQFV